MNLPPSAPPPMAAPPPPPPKKSNAVKWILIGCGGVAFIGLLICGGCFIWFGGMAKSYIKVQEEVESLVENNAEVKEESGNLKKLEPDDEPDQQSSADVVFEYKVVGSKGEGTARARVRFTFTKFELKSATFETKDGRSIKLK